MLGQVSYVFYLTIKTCWKFLLHITSRFHTTFPLQYYSMRKHYVKRIPLKISCARKEKCYVRFYDNPFCRYIKSEVGELFLGLPSQLFMHLLNRTVSLDLLPFSIHIAWQTYHIMLNLSRIVGLYCHY